MVWFRGGEADLFAGIGPVDYVSRDDRGGYHFFVGFERVMYGDKAVEGGDGNLFLKVSMLVKGGR